jgi:hypothetical protein
MTEARQVLTACGEALYGSRWQTELSQNLDVDDRTIRRWVAGDSPVPPGVFVDLHRLLLERAAEIDDLLPLLLRVAAP